LRLARRGSGVWVTVATTALTVLAAPAHADSGNKIDSSLLHAVEKGREALYMGFQRVAAVMMMPGPRSAGGAPHGGLDTCRRVRR